jgi:hypothetical protein
MAGPGDPFTPGPTVDPTAGIPGPDQFEQLRNQWTTFLDQPGARAALLQFGTTLLQPPQFGQTGAGQIGQALSAGGEAVSRGEEQKSKEDTAAARAEAATARAGEAGSRLSLEQFRRQSIEKGQQEAQAMQAIKTYQMEKQKAQAAYADWVKNFNLGLRPDKPPPTFPEYSFEQWARDTGAIALPGVARIVGAGRATAPAAKPQQQTETPEGE